MTQLTSSPSQKMENTSIEETRSLNAQPPMDSAKKKKSHKSKRDNSSPVPDGLSEAPREKKRKRTSEPGQKKQKKQKSGRDDESRDKDNQMLKPEPDTPSAPNIEEPEEPEESNPDLTKRGQPRKARGSRIGGKNNMKVGFYTKDEVEKLEAYKVAFCNLHHISDHKVFDSMVQHSERTGPEHRSTYEWPCPADECTKAEFWAEIYELIPDRDRRSLYRFMRRHFQDSTQKPHEWTPEQDQELIQLMTLHPGKWAYVARLIGRSDDDVTQRWKNQLEHRGKMNRGKWSEEEIQSLLDAIKGVWDKVQEDDSDGKDMYEIDEKHLKWGVISDLLGNVRSRQQCADKWRKIKRHVESLRAAGNPNAQYDPIEAVNKATRWSLSASTTPKSSYFVEEDKNDDGDSKDTSMPGSHARVGFGLSADTPAESAKFLPPESASEAESESDANDNEPSSPVLPFAGTSLPQSNPGDDARSSKKRKHSVTEDETKEQRRERKAQRKQKRRERKEAKRAAAAAAATNESEPSSGKKKKSKRSRESPGEDAVVNEDVAASTPQNKKKKKNRKSTDVNGAAIEETPTDSPKKVKKSKKAKQSNGAGSTHSDNV